MSMPESIRIVEVGPRDGLQNEAGVVPLAVKLDLIDRLAEAGCRTIEAGSFVSPKWVPQMADSGALFKDLKRRSGVVYTALVPNLRGLEDALACGVEEVAVFASASEAFSERNINCSIEESLLRFAPVLERAKAAGVKVRGYVSCVLGCPYQGAVEASAVASVSARLFEMGCYEISLGDTIGIGTPLAARAMLEVVSKRVPIDALALHFHDTYGQALANIYACLDLGVRVLDSSVGGLGGCPYAKGASGNVATEDLAYMLHGMGIETGLDIEKLVAIGLFISGALGKAPASHLGAMKRAV